VACASQRKAWESGYRGGAAAAGASPSARTFSFAVHRRAASEFWSAAAAAGAGAAAAELTHQEERSALAAGTLEVGILEEVWTREGERKIERKVVWKTFELSWRAECGSEWSFSGQ